MVWDIIIWVKTVIIITLLQLFYTSRKKLEWLVERWKIFKKLSF